MTIRASRAIPVSLLLAASAAFAVACEMPTQAEPGVYYCQDDGDCGPCGVCNGSGECEYRADRCDDGNPCTRDECGGQDGCRSSGLGVTEPCDDGNACTTGDSCQGDEVGGCAGTDTSATDCDDGNPCTNDTCDPRSGCAHDGTGVSLPCDDSDACTTNDICRGDRAGTCGGTDTSATDCDDGNPCTDDSCAPASGCIHAPNTADCDDGDACTLGDACADGTCRGATQRDCDDGNVCTDDACEAASGCTHADNLAACDDGDACTTVDVCDGGECRGDTAPDCDDGNPCTADACDPANGCVHPLHVGECAAARCDGLVHVAAAVCVVDECPAPVQTSCDDGNPCTVDSCDPEAGCAHDGTGVITNCNDGNECTTGDACRGNAAGDCAGTDTSAVACDDHNPCTDDSCDPLAGCGHTNRTGGCADARCDGLLHVAAATCDQGQCPAPDVTSCDDGNPCTDDTCDPAVGCGHTNRTGGCADARCDGLVHVAAATCDQGQCPAPVQTSCDDGNPCTDDTCDPAVGCGHTNRTGGCADARCDGLVHVAAAVCDQGQCPAPDVTSCDDGNPCTTDSCDSVEGCVSEVVADCCAADDDCGEGERCESGACVCECSQESGPCCGECGYLPATHVCEAETEYECPAGTGCGAAYQVQTRDRYCSGSAAGCSGEFGDWSAWAVQACGDTQRCDESLGCVAAPECEALRWISIPAGNFPMGCSVGDGDCPSDEEPRHTVTVPAFDILETEVTEAQYAALMDAPDPSCDAGDGGGPDSPVECVSWEDARTFCAQAGGRLCSEAEWEYAARGGTTTVYACGDDPTCLADVAWYDANSGDHKHDVRGLDPNGFGLYDMFGNVWEWVEDDWHDSYAGAPDDGTAWVDWVDSERGPTRAYRGGDFSLDAAELRASNRGEGLAPAGQVDVIGLRCCRGPE
jgi:formylglycine-generating enzyme required for sulfatase activity